MNTIFEKLEEYNKDFPAERVNRKFTLLSRDAFSFFRGTNHLFYEDLSKVTLPLSPVSWICGDLHIENFGSYKGDNRLVYFDLNDFDESILAPVGWELARVLTSIMVAFDSLKITDKEAKKACEIFLIKYLAILSQGNPRYIETRTAKGIVKRFLNTVENRPDKKLLGKHTSQKKGGLLLSECKRKQLKIDSKLKTGLIKACQSWMKSNSAPPNDYKVLDVRFRFAGTGSIGIHRYLFLIQKINEPDKYRLIDMKQATASSLSPYVQIDQPIWKSEAQRMVYIQKMLQNVAPAQLSELDFEGGSYLMQEMQPAKDRINFKIIEDDFKVVCCVIEDMAMITASAHLRGTGRRGSCSADELIAFGNDEAWHAELLKYALTYKNKVMSDYRDFRNQWRIRSSANSRNIKI